MKNSLRKGLLLFCAVLGFGMAHAQSVSGTVSDANGPLPGASVLVKGTTIGAQTDFDGNYSLSNVPANAVLVFSYVGFKTAEVAVGGRTTISITLEEDAQALEEVVLVGYGSVRKKDATGAVASVKAEDFNKGINTSADQLLQGRVSGVQITQSSGEPGAASNIRVRGTSSIRGGNEPLIVVDGVPLSGGSTTPDSNNNFGGSSSTNPLNFINSADIESIDVLKDASATAIYGSRGANGVVLITTKGGKSGKPQISYSSSYSFANVSERLDVFDAKDFAAAAATVGNTTADLGARVDPFNNIIRSAFTQTQDVSFAGGSESGNYRVSLGYLDQEGIIKNTGQEKYTANINITQNAFNNRVKLNINTIASFVRDDRAAIGDFSGAEGDLISSALKWNPTQALRKPDGSFDQDGQDNKRNPLALIDLYKDLTETTRIFTNLGVSVKIIEGLSYKINVGIDHSKADRRIGISKDLNTNETSGRGRADLRTQTRNSILFENTLTYDKNFGDNYKLNFVGGYSFQRFENRGSFTTARDFTISDPNTMIKNVGFARTFEPNEQGSFEEPKNDLQSYFGRANVTFFDKYLLTATLRVDGSSRFGSNEQYGYFPSVGAAWQIHKEGWLPDYVSDLKLRVNYGITGNQEFPSGAAQTQFGPSEGGGGLKQITVANKNLQWEETESAGVGIDFGFLNDRFTGSIDYYYKETTDILFRLPAIQPAPDVFFWRNFSDVSIQNQGIDISLSGDIVQTKDFKFSLNYNMSFLDNRIVGISKEFPLGIQTGAITGRSLSGERSQLLFDDHALFSFYLPILEGYNNAGEPLFKDVNGDGIRNPNFDGPGGTSDRAFVGDPNPDFTVGIQANLSYKKWDMSAFFNGAYGAEIFDNTAAQLFVKSALLGGENISTKSLKTNAANNEGPILSDKDLKSGDFLRLNNLTLGYTFDSAQLKQSWINSVRVSVTGQNLFVITPYDGFDPEVNVNKQVDGVPSFGIDSTAFPRSTSIVFGLTANF